MQRLIHVKSRLERFIMKKFVLLGVALLAVTSLTACSNSGQKQEEKTYDTEFVESVAKGLEARWSYQDSPAAQLNKETFKTVVEKESKPVEGFEDKKFKNNKLKEEALAYINSLEELEKTVEQYGSANFDQKWADDNYNRSAILKEINTIEPIKVAKKYQSNLDEVLTIGNNISQENQSKEALNKFIDSITFTKKENEYSDSVFSEYEATVENTSGLDFEFFNMTLKLKDDSDLVLDTQYITEQNWPAGEKRVISFMSDKPFTKMEKNNNGTSMKK